ncbi:hypothetical protein L2E82_24328 [Cichorium intybus]|uniref:Uncharacterized protein n=1 Tax=Cichorium intybus TaxID=13427 RepID=A0ACB9E1M6_CICIN|nr:hypothetical protein L2E82_24328 [Cichorium intybus]
MGYFSRIWTADMKIHLKIGLYRQYFSKPGTMNDQQQQPPQPPEHIESTGLGLHFATTQVYTVLHFQTTLIAVARIDLNHADIAGFLPNELGLLSDLSLLHLNSNRFCGILPLTLSNLTFLIELDLSNNRFVGPFPSVVMSRPSLTFLDLRFNEFEGALPLAFFNKNLYAIFINNKPINVCDSFEFRVEHSFCGGFRE